MASVRIGMEHVVPGSPSFIGSRRHAKCMQGVGVATRTQWACRGAISAAAAAAAAGLPPCWWWRAVEGGNPVSAGTVCLFPLTRVYGGQTNTHTHICSSGVTCAAAPHHIREAAWLTSTDAAARTARQRLACCSPSRREVFYS